jgi:hypothetical protein
MAAPTEELLAQRGTTHGDYADHARITQELKSTIMKNDPYFSRLNDMQRESLDMIVHKIGRILAGNPNFADHWDDIAGYARLVSQRIATE